MASYCWQWDVTWEFSLLLDGSQIVWRVSPSPATIAWEIQWFKVPWCRNEVQHDNLCKHHLTLKSSIKTIWLLNPILIIELEWMQWLWILSRLWRTFHGTRLADDQAVGDNCVAIMGQHSTPQMPREVATRRVYIKAAFSLTLPWNMCFLVNVAVGSAIIINICLPF